jgi:hypothetical protein
MIKNCSKCKRIINQKSINVGGLLFHPECFVCAKCNKKINGQYNLTDKKFYHSECHQQAFNMFCTVCKKSIQGQYITSGVRKYHEECYKKFIQLKCKICNNPISGEYVHDKEGSYHNDCYNQNKALKCNICNEIIDGKYFIDDWGNKSHLEHKGIKPEYCDCCSRILSETTSKKFIKYPDNRKICGICQETEIIEIHQTIPLKLDVIEQLNNVGFKYIPAFIKISLDNKININKLLGSSITNNTHGYTKTIHKSIHSKEHSICMLYGLPKLLFKGVLAHELLHVWLNEKNIDMIHEKTEGFCNLGAELIYQNDNSDFAKILLKKLESDTDLAYGEGYRQMSKRLKEIGWQNLINEVSKKI